MKKETLGQICDRTGGSIQTGPFGAQLHQTDYREEGVAVVMPQDIVDNRICDIKISKIEESLASKLGRYRLQKGDIIYPRRGDINKRAILEDSTSQYLCGTGCLKISIPSLELHPKWLYYFLGQPLVSKWIESKAVGTTMLNLNTSILRSLVVAYPEYGVQQSTASILSAYDDLITANQRRIQLLEESARLLYREWFVKLRFPGHETVSVTDGVPEGWSHEKLEAAFILQRGFDLPASDRLDGDIPVYASTGVTGFHNQAKVTGPGVVTGRSGTLGEVHFVYEDFWPLNTTLWVKEFKKTTPLIAYFMLGALDLAIYNSGASVPSLDRKTVHGIDIVIPASQVQRHFELAVIPMFDQIRAITQYNEKLRQARDLLLPKLMSGALDVSGIAVPKEAAA